MLCVIDDAHLLDPESLDVLGLVARRLEAESVALVMAGARHRARRRPSWPAFPVCPSPGSRPSRPMRLLSASLPEPIDPAAAAQVIAATGGNPLALVDLARELSVRRLTEVEPGGRAAADRSPPRGALPAADPPPRPGPPDLAADRRRRLHRQHRPDPGSRPVVGPAGRSGRGGRVGGPGRARPDHQVPAPAGPLGGVQRRPGLPAQAGPPCAGGGRGAARPGRGRGVARRQGDAGHRRGRRRPARAGRRRSRAAGRSRLPRAGAGPGVDAHPARSC